MILALLIPYLHLRLGVMSQSPFSREVESVNVVIIGPSGAGKSTLENRLLYSIDEPEGGFVVGHGLHSETMECHQKGVKVDMERSLQVRYHYLKC